MNTLSETIANPLLPRERELLKTISKLLRKDPEKVIRLEDLVESGGLPLTSTQRTLKSLIKKGRVDAIKVRGMQLTVKEPA